MMALPPIVDRLKAAGFRHVEGVLEFASLADAPRYSPALFVVTERESAEPNRMAGVIDQKVTEAFSVLLVVQAGRMEGKVSDDLKQHGDGVVDAVVGWKHPEASGRCEYVGARLVSVEGRHVVWAVSFRTSRHIRKESQ